jgi:hypothetical protein
MCVAKAGSAAWQDVTQPRGTTACAEIWRFPGRHVADAIGGLSGQTIYPASDTSNSRDPAMAESGDDVRKRPMLPGASNSDEGAHPGAPNLPCERFAFGETRSRPRWPQPVAQHFPGADSGMGPQNPGSRRSAPGWRTDTTMRFQQPGTPSICAACRSANSSMPTPASYPDLFGSGYAGLVPIYWGSGRPSE